MTTQTEQTEQIKEIQRIEDGTNNIPESISLAQLQEIMDQLSADIHRDIKALEEGVAKNQGALLGLATLINRINLALNSQIVEAEVVTGEKDMSSDYSSPI